jgi:hypothetical protein
VAPAFPTLERLHVVFPTLRAAAAVDPDVAAAYERFVLDARLDGYRPVAARLRALGALPDGMREAAAAEILWAVLAPDAYALLVGHRRWSGAAFRRWAIRTLVATLVSP